MTMQYAKRRLRSVWAMTVWAFDFEAIEVIQGPMIILTNGINMRNWRFQMSLGIEVNMLFVRKRVEYAFNCRYCPPKWHMDHGSSFPLGYTKLGAAQYSMTSVAVRVIFIDMHISVFYCMPLTFDKRILNSSKLQSYYQAFRHSGKTDKQTGKCQLNHTCSFSEFFLHFSSSRAETLYQ